ncbi:MAG: calcium/sodium antiporter [Meiothermus sp.]|uniref:calcium/sodium antiporter n=1 Tax=Meiothermus sp. TaxID=1955249 RepID=UPI0025E9C83F|nr:calcium/sodium antiporter [Meiothermus sp.]MCS7058951.1 calcium/sodium antiporter [Meiothermus sp.]MCS7194673.1 calcium/sodium antiporter [Meiothermus sp.]MDW8090514.1 calcium/sodium antiporter [Meiothermus sp.]MDW8482164.1 calcium/sodium antiporter [Meiothermus sp.]
MDWLLNLLLIALGVVLLYFGGEALVKNAVVLARSWGVSTMVVGLTVVAFGTSSPELAASLAAALSGSPAIALGNVVGSNILNILLILGLTALIQPIRTQALFIKREMPILIGTTALLFPMVYFDGQIGRGEGILLLLLLGLYIWFLFRDGEESAEVQQEFDQEYGRPSQASWKSYLGVVLGLVLLGVGARVLTKGSVALAQALGVPELVIGLTVVALGTSLPEVAASITAALRHEPDIALGNIVGSNIFNILGILGATASVAPISLPWESVARDAWVMLGASLLLWPFLATGLRLGRREGGVFLGLYALYIVWILHSSQGA